METEKGEKSNKSGRNLCYSHFVDHRKLCRLLRDQIVALEVIVLCVSPVGGGKSDLRDLVTYINPHLHTIRRTKANWTGHIMRRSCLLKHVTARKIDNKRIEVMRRRSGRRKQLLGGLKETEDHRN
jgi:hypothetical protein